MIGLLQINPSEIPTGTVTSPEATIIISGFTALKPALTGDTVKVSPETQTVTEVIERASHKNIPGIIEITSQTVYGIAKNGDPIFIFKPTDRRYPNFLVSSSLRTKARKAQVKVRDQYILINFKEWCGKIPTGTCVRVIGPVGDLETEFNHILLVRDLEHKSFKSIIKKNQELQKQINNHHNEKLVLGNRVDFREQMVFSIDPEGCLDIDDALHLQKLASGDIEIGVHIADVSYWIQENTLLDALAQSRLSTIYAPHMRLDLFPEEYATRLCSLQPNETRYTLSVLFTFNSEGKLLPEKTQFQEGVIQSQRAYTYREVDVLLSNDDPMFCEISDIVQKNQGGSDAYPSVDAHRLVEFFMILTNKSVAQKLATYLPDKTILRVHNEKIVSDMLKYPDNLAEHMQHTCMEAAQYVLFSDVKGKPIHYGLEVDFYTHFTSPIRRYPDLVTHRLLKTVLGSTKSTNAPNLSEICQNANLMNQRIKKAQREWKFLEIVSQWEKEFAENEQQIVGEGYITEINAPWIRLYLPQWDLTLNFKLIHRELESLLEQKQELNKMTIQYRDKTILTLKLYEKISLNIVPNLGAKKLSQKVKLSLDEFQLEMK